MCRFRCALLATVAVIGFASVASAADMPVKAPAAVVSESGYYFWLDGMYNRVRLPTYNLGFRNTTPGPFNDTGPVQSYDPRLNAGGVRGAFGYVMPGTSTKFELGGSYVGGNGSGSQSTTSSSSYVTVLFLNGSGQNNAFSCNGVSVCSTVGNLSTSFSAWQINGKVSNDWKYGSVTVTPSLAVFGGNTRVGQSFSQLFSQPFFSRTGTYSVSTTERWTDIGARVGVDINAPVTTALTVGIGGWVGGANRRTSLSGNDAGTDTVGGAVFGGASTLSIGDSKSVFLANVEAGLAYKVTSAVTLRGFAGLNYDGSVPGIASPSFTGDISAPTSRTAASINYAHETSYYAGGGVAVKW